MRDIHSHILPGVDDGSHNLDESLRMIEAAQQVGITSIVCTPHCRDPYFDYDRMRESFEILQEHAQGFPLTMGFEVNHSKLMELGLDWAPRLCFADRSTFLLELSTHAKADRFKEYFSTIYELQGMGMHVIIAHPERYAAIEDDLSLAQQLVDAGCELQLSSDCVVGGKSHTNAKQVARHLIKANVISYIASDAHCPEDYDYYRRLKRKFYPQGTHARFAK